jgi:hypothetical protein
LHELNLTLKLQRIVNFEATISNLNHLLAWNEAVFAGPVSAVVEALEEILRNIFFLSYLMPRTIS